MKKKLLMLLVTVMTTCLMACASGKDAKTSSEPTEAPELVATETPTPEPTETPTPTPEPTNTPTPTPEPVDTRFEDGVAKVERMLEAYNTLLDQDLEINNWIQCDTECLYFSCQNVDGINTADGLHVMNGGSISSACIAYYNHYVNENGEYYDLQAWIAEQPNDRYLWDLYFADYNPGDTYYTADILLFEAIGLMSYFEKYGVNGIEMMDSTDYEVSHITSSYIIKLESNGDSFIAIFDEENNLLNIIPENEEWNGYICSFGW